ncbi:hypothetical protein ACHWQZ_G003561 [Mnemiopsis leidyi]
MTGFCLYIVVQLLSGYYQYDSYNLEYSRVAQKYTLPAITICNVNPLNYTKLKEKGIYPAYKDWINVIKKRNSTEDEEKTEPNGDLDDIDIHTQFKMDIKASVIDSLTSFAREPTTYKNFTSFAYTSNGDCMEMNDNEVLVQRVNGAIGGLTLVLDTLTGDYLPETETAGFLVTLRMSNETVLSQEFGFLVAPGKQHNINLRTRKVTRLPEPWGNCEETVDHFDGKGFLTFKECYLNQMLWMYPKLRDLGCGCYPWYFYERYIQDPEDSKYEPNIGWKLIKYWTEVLPEQFRFNFTDTCKYEESSYKPNSGQIREESGVVSMEECAEICRDDTNCRYFLFTDTTNDILEANKCVLYKRGAEMEIIPSKNIVAGLVWGDTQCLNMEKCSVSAGAACVNKIMNELMGAEEEDLDDNGKSKTPPTCYEPCSYMEHSYDVSVGDFPTRKYWDDYLSKEVSNYDNYDTARLNLLKLVFYTDQMSSIELEQTPSYEITSFIAELGGLTDLFIGFSFFTAYQFFEWLVTRVVRKLQTERRTIDSSDNVNVEDANL